MIPLFKVFLGNDVYSSVETTLKSGMITQGPVVEKFESELRKLFNYEHLLTVNSATSGLTLAIRMLKDELNLENTHEVLTSPLTCMATNEPILANDLKIKWVDTDPMTCNLDLDDLENKITKNTRILICVHWGGNPIDMDKLENILLKKEAEFGHKVRVVEDCAHSMLAEWNDHKLGTTHNHYGVYSLQAIKHLTSGDGGIVCFPSNATMERGRLLRWFGIDRAARNYGGKDLRLENDVETWGYKYHMNDINASIGLSNIAHVHDIVNKHISNAEYYSKMLKDQPGVQLLDVHSSSKPVFWIYTLLVDRRDDFIEFMKTKNIMVSCVHKRNDINTCFKNFRIDLPNLDCIESKYVCIPVGWWVTETEREFIVDCIKTFYGSNHS